MKDPTKKTQFVLRLCGECRKSTHYWWLRDRVFKCMECGREEEIPPADHDRDGLIED